MCPPEGHGIPGHHDLMMRLHPAATKPQDRTGERRFYGWRIIGAAFVLAIFGWGLGLLRSAGLSARDPGDAWLERRTGLDRSHRPFPDRSFGRRQPADALSPV